MSAADEQDLANVEIDEAVFENAKPCDIAMIESIMVEDKRRSASAAPPSPGRTSSRSLASSTTPGVPALAHRDPRAQTSMAFSTRWRTTASPMGMAEE